MYHYLLEKIEIRLYWSPVNYSYRLSYNLAMSYFAPGEIKKNMV